MMKHIDLHTHSVYSDGTYTPEELVHYAHKKGLSAISLTDHDTIDGLEEAKHHSEITGIRFINGVEINSFCYLNNRKISIHVLGYMFNIDKLNNYMGKLKTLRYEHNTAIMKALNTNGIPISFDEFDVLSTKNTITRLHFAKILVKKGYAQSVKDALSLYLRKGGIAYVDYNNDPFSIVAQMIHDAGGIVALAHPGQYGLEQGETESMIRKLKQVGLDAIECIHPSHDIPYARNLMNLSKQYSLDITGGSDFHGNIEKGLDLGVGGDDMLIPEAFLTKLYEKH